MCIRSMRRPESPIPSSGTADASISAPTFVAAPPATTGALGHPPVIYKDLVIFAGRTSQVLPASPAPVRAYDARTGKLRWQFNTIPHPGEYGYDTWPKDAWTYTAGAVSWTGMALDEKRGIVFVPTSNTVNNNIGLDRPGDNLFANSLLALDAATGKRHLALSDGTSTTCGTAMSRRLPR